MVNRVLYVCEKDYAKDFYNRLLEHIENLDYIDSFKECFNSYYKLRYNIVLVDFENVEERTKRLIHYIKSLNPSVYIIGASYKIEEDSNEFELLKMGFDDLFNMNNAIDIVVIKLLKLLERWENKLNNQRCEKNNLEIDIYLSQVRKDNKIVCLTKKEFNILSYFLQRKECIVTKDEIVLLIGLERTNDTKVDNYHDRIINNHISRIRKKLELDCIETIYGQGYIWR